MNLQTIKYFMGVSMPFMLTFATLNMILIVGINGVPGNFMGPILSVDLTNLQIPPSNFTTLTGLTVSGNDNITAASIGLADKYSFYLWNYASTTGDGKRTFYDKNFDWVSKLNLSEITVNGVSSEVPSSLSHISSGFRNKIRFSELVFLATLMNGFFVLAIGIAACFGQKFRLIIVSFFTGITFVTVVILAALITSASLGTSGDLHKFKDFGLTSQAGTSDLGVVWFAAVHIIPVCIMWGLMAVGLMKMNPSVLTAPKPRTMDEELMQSSSGRDYSTVDLGSK
jgi:hypothetical protein